MKKTISLTANYADLAPLNGWRQYQYNIRQVKQAYRKAHQMKRSTSKNEDKKYQRDIAIAQAQQHYIDLSQVFIDKSQATLATKINRPHAFSAVNVLEIEGFIQHAERQIDQIKRRVILNEIIPHKDKVFSIFQPHTEWINKGKAGVPVELGLRVCIVEATQGYILHHTVMQHETDNQLISETIQRYPNFNACSFDKGFHSPENQIELTNQLDKVVL